MAKKAKLAPIICKETQKAPTPSVSTWVLLLTSIVLGSCVWHYKQLDIFSHNYSLQSLLVSGTHSQRVEGPDSKYEEKHSAGHNRSWHHPAAQQMIEWIRSNGGVVNVDVLEAAGQGRITVAPFNFKAGDVFAVIPRKACFNGHPDNEWVSAALFAAELEKNISSRYSPFIAALPERSQVWSYYDLPASYVPLVQNTALEAAILQLQEGFMTWHKQQGDAETIADVRRQLADMLHDELRYSMSLIKTRMFVSQFGQLMVPLIDMANHHNSCKHTITTYPDCGPGLEDGCLVWSAGEAVAAGDEVCNIYHADMLQDRAVLQYGFLQEGDPVHQLSSIDRFDYNTDLPWSFEASLQPFNQLRNSTADITREVARLGDLLLRLRALDEEQQGLAVDAQRDPQGQMLKQLQLWRQQRQAAVRSELARLQDVLDTSHFQS